MKKIICISGTSRPGNFTSHALRVVSAELVTLGLEVEFIDARDLELAFPGHPATADATKLQGLVKEAEGVILATPEYHGSFSAMTKLIVENLGFPSALGGKPVALLGVAAGRIGAIKSLEQLKGVCSHIGAIVVPGAVSIAGVQQAFDADGNCKDDGTARALAGLAKSMGEFLKDYIRPKYILEEMARQDVSPWTTSV